MISSRWDAFEIANSKPRAKRRTNWVPASKEIDFLNFSDDDSVLINVDNVDRESIKLRAPSTNKNHKSA